MKNEKIKTILDKLEKEYPEAECALTHRNNFELLVAVTLSAQTTDKSVNVVTKDLFSTYDSAQKLGEAKGEDVEKIIKRIGLYKTKAKNIVGIGKKLVENHNGQVPMEYEELVSLPGVGRKTANVVMSVGFGIPRIAVDTHVFRVSNRIGLVKASDVLKTELALMKAIPEESWSMAHHSLIFHGRNCCYARNPNCQECIIVEECKKEGVKRERGK